MSTATVTMPIDQYNGMREAQVAADARITELNASLTAARISADGSGRVQNLGEGLTAALEIIGFAIANLSPEIIRKWPYERLRTVAAMLPSLPDYDAHNAEQALEYRKFANECEQWELKRKQEPERYVPPPAGAQGQSLG